MKKFFFILTAFVCAMSLQAKTIYLNAGGSALWDQGGAVFFVHSWGGTTAASSVKMNLVGVGVYGAEIADDRTGCVFVRMPKGSTSVDWDAAWNQTNDLTFQSGKNCYQITGWGEGEGAKSTGVWTSYEPAPLNYYIAGEGLPGVDWDNHLLMEGDTIQFADLAAGTYKFKVTTGDWTGIVMGFSAVDPTCSNRGYVGDNDGNVVVQFVSVGTLTVRVVNGALCLVIVGETEEPVSGTGVPSECPDVLLQAFYYDSYSVDSTHMGTDMFGDTKWKTLQKQVGEIGAYFDLVWLPPSALASGVGYHPRQYCNQNSDWGTRADLEKLIASLHNSDTKVVADIVINHSEAMGGWCDMAEENFDEYGLFTPGPSYITSNDEVNWPSMNVDTLAGDCWGYSQNSKADDGENWDAARDWAHDNVEVQEMFKAYLKWMKNVMHYDGWRYDKGDGYNNWHMHNYNMASEPYIAFEERYDGNAENLKNGIRDAQMNMMALDFALKFNGINPIQGWDYVGRSGLIGKDDTGSDYWKKHSVTWVDNHDMFMREDNDLEFCGRGNSMKEEIKPRLLGANAFILSMPGVPCIFYPHWYKYKEELKEMINARHLAGVHSESEVSGEYYDMDGDRHAGYQATVRGKNGWLILCLGTKANGQGFGPDYQLMSSCYHTFNDNGKPINESYEIWVNATGEHDPAPGLIVTPSQFFEDSINGINVTIEAVGGNGTPIIYYTTDETIPTTESAVYTDTLNFTETTTLKVMAVCGNATSKVQTYTYTYREPLQRGIQVRFNKPESWEKVYFYAWKPYKDEAGEDASENIMGAYPGRRIYQDMEGWYTYEFAADMDSVNFCINSGDDCGGINVRSNDLVTDYDACYGWRAGKDTTANEEELLDCEMQLHPAFDISVGPESQYFSENEEIDVVINAVGEENAIIYYTTDGREPTTASASGVSPITFKVNKTTTVKAYAQKDKTRTATKSATYTYKAPQSGPLEVRFIKPAQWEDLYLYAFTRVKVDGKYKDTPYSLDGKSAKWPGMKWTTTEGKWYKHVMKPEVKEIYVIFTEGNKKPQTQDIYLTENTCYLWNEGCHKAVIDRDCDGEPDEPWIEGIEVIENKVKNNNETYKLIINGQLVIVHNGAMYDVLGRKL